MRLLVDDMLGSLARWLRIAGHDVLYGGDVEGGDDALLRRSREEGRVLVTRDVELASRSGDSVLLGTRDLDEQLSKVADALGLELEPVMERCTLCNSELVPAESVDEDYVPEDAEDLMVCSSCGRYYWRGSHWERIRERLGRIREGHR
ncbi:MAG: hypothetical protein MAG715_00286 [Methanonatronarchaeales archaeon]|nr:hypothetical protein [Methanonatronarchaeales archaeon]